MVYSGECNKGKYELLYVSHLSFNNLNLKYRKAIAACQPYKKTNGMFVLNADVESVNLRKETGLNVKPIRDETIEVFLSLY